MITFINYSNLFKQETKEQNDEKDNNLADALDELDAIITEDDDDHPPVYFSVSFFMKIN